MNKEPWDLFPGLWKSKSAFFTYLRGQIRLTWSRFPAKITWKNSKLVAPPQDYKGRAKKLGQCSYCNEMFAASSLEVDHIEQAGTCNSWETAAQFLRNLLDCNDNWCLACKPCHKIKSYSEKTGLSFEDAKLQKKVIEFMKQNTKVIVEFCQKSGYNERSLTNKASRQAAVETILKGQIHG